MTELYDENDMSEYDENDMSDDPLPCRCENDGYARKGFISVQVEEDGYEEIPCPDCNKNDWQNKKHCDKCEGTGMYYDDPEKAKIRTGVY